MGDFDRVVDKNSKQLLGLTKSLKNYTKLQCKLSEAQLAKHDVVKRKKVRHRFRKHPEALRSESDLSVASRAKNGLSHSGLSFNFSTSSALGTAHSERSVFSNNYLNSTKVMEQIYIAENRKLCPQTTVSIKKIKERVFQNTVNLKAHKASSKTHVKPNNKCAPNSNTKKEGDQTLCRLMERILSCMEDIRVIMKTGIEPPDGLEDWERARTRTVEFEKRFTRNFLYELMQKMTQVEAMPGKDGQFSSLTARNIHQCFVTVHKSIFQSLEAYRGNMTTLLANTLAEKLLVVTQQTFILCKVHTKYLNLVEKGSSKRESLIDELIKKCQSLSEVAHDLIHRRSKIDAPISAPKRLTLMGYNVNQPKAIKPKRSKNKLETKLSMYSISTVRSSDPNFKQTTKMLTKDKLKLPNASFKVQTIPSRYRTALFKHRPPPAKPTVINLGDLESKCKFFGTQTSCQLQNTPECTRQNEDDIVTLMGMEKNTNDASVTMVSECQRSSYVSMDTQRQGLTPEMLQELEEKLSGINTTTMTQNQMEHMLKTFKGIELGGKINITHNEGCGAEKNGYALQEGPPEQTLQKLLQNMRSIISGMKQKGEGPVGSQAPQGLVDGVPEKLVEGVLRTEAENELMESQNCATYKHSRGFQSGTPRMPLVRETKQFGMNHEANLNKIKTADKGQLCKNKNRRRQTVTVTGVKNAQLICIRDEDSIVESTGATKKNKKTKSGLKSWLELHKIQSKPSKQLLFMSSVKMEKLFQYKLDYMKFTRGKAVYQHSSTTQPWEIVSYIADNLVETLLGFISKELLANPLPTNIYVSEFQ